MKNTNELDLSLNEYGKTADSGKKSMSKARMLGFGAAALGGLFATSQADADIFYTQFNQTLNTSTGLGLFQNFALDIDGDATDEMVIGINAATTSLGGPGFVAFRGYGFAPAGVAAGGGNVPLTFGSSTNINATSGTAAGNFWMGWNYASDTTGAGVFNPLSNGTTPNPVIIGGQTSSGFAYWLRLELTNDVAGTPATLTVVDYAYDNMNTFIHAGSTGVPEPGSLGLLALAGGAAAIARRRKSA